jgi:Na+/citrate or Na+/malate symporter
LVGSLLGVVYAYLLDDNWGNYSSVYQRCVMGAVVWFIVWFLVSIYWRAKKEGSYLQILISGAISGAIVFSIQWALIYQDMPLFITIIYGLVTGGIIGWIIGIIFVGRS